MKTSVVNGFDVRAWHPDIEVPMGRWDMTTAQSIGTLGLGPCIGVAVYDPNSLRGYLSHAYADDLTVVERMLEQATDTASDATTLDLWVSGGEISRDCEDLCKAARFNTLELLNNAGIDQNQIELLWVEKGSDCSVMTLDCLAGQCEVSFIDLSKK